MDNSILDTIKKLLGLDSDYTAFDTDIIVFINTAIMALRQMGIGPSDGFSISDNSSLWSDLVGDSKKLEDVKTYIYLRVRILFDPPQNGTLMQAFKDNIAECEFRLSCQVNPSEDNVL